MKIATRSIKANLEERVNETGKDFHNCNPLPLAVTN